MADVLQCSRSAMAAASMTNEPRSSASDAASRIIAHVAMTRSRVAPQARAMLPNFGSAHVP